MFYCTGCASPAGSIALASDGESLCGLWFEGQRHFMEGLEKAPTRMDALPVFDLARGWLGRYFALERPDPLALPLKPQGSEHMRAVWRELLRIPYGETVSYGELASRLSAEGIRTCARAVASALARNPISIIIPCHRVVGKDGALTGYAGGLEKKRFLLTLEGAL